MTVLFFVSEVIARLIDRRRARHDAEGDYGAYSDDEASPLAIEHDPDDEVVRPVEDD